MKQGKVTSYQTGMPAALVTDLMAKGVIAIRGAVSSEALDPMPFNERLPLTLTRSI